MNELRARERQIAEVLVKQGFAQIPAALGLNGIPSSRHRAGDDDDAPRNLHAALEELGPTFIKLGQMLSTRGDLLSPRYRTELAKLQDAAPRAPAALIQRTLEQELGAGAFTRLDLEPLASASIGQAHLASLHDATEVVVKVRRPGAREQIEQDLAILQHRVAQASRHLHVVARLDWVGFGRGVRADPPRRARLRAGGTQRRALRGELRRRPAGPDPARLLGDHHGRRDHARAHARHQGHRPRRTAAVGRRPARAGVAGDAGISRREIT